MAEYIERGDLIRRLELSIKSCGRDCNSNAPVMVRSYQDILHRVKNLPTADVVEVRHGHWINDICSVCGVDLGIYDIDWFNYCPFCGAKMDGKDGAE